MGYMIAILVQIRIAALLVRFIECLVSFGFACFLFSLAAADDMKNDIRLMNENARKKQTRPLIFEQFSEFIRFVKFRRFVHILKLLK